MHTRILVTPTTLLISHVVYYFPSEYCCSLSYFFFFATECIPPHVLYFASQGYYHVLCLFTSVYPYHVDLDEPYNLLLLLMVIFASEAF
jgi:hypothetical protein